ncbi:MAG: SWIB/MDM2 domain-containing protein, partial [Bdellovibrionales bacterium]|nr:SWIB/MDM2 domain-containing protein [Bdellovibrionales bacterium]
MAKKTKKKVSSKKKKVTKKVTKSSKKTTKKKVKKTPAKKTKRKVNSAFMKKMKVSSDLQKVIGVSSVSRPEATKKVWEYIRKHKLQDSKDRRMIKVGG